MRTRSALAVLVLVLAAAAGCAIPPAAPGSSAYQLFGPFAPAMDASDREGSACRQADGSWSVG